MPHAVHQGLRIGLHQCLRRLLQRDDPYVDAILDQRRDEVFIIPDILCNAGGVIVSYFEWVQGLQQFFWTEAEVMERLYKALDRSYRAVIERARKDGISNRKAALAI